MSEPSENAAPSRQSGFRWLGGVLVRHPVIVILIWVAMAAILPALLPSLAQIVRDRPVNLLPAHDPATVAATQMASAFHEGENALLVVLTDEQGLGRADEDTYHGVADNLRRNPGAVSTVQDFITTPPLRQALESGDHKAWVLPVSLVGDLGTPTGQDSSEWVTKTVADSTAGTSLTAHVTGPEVTFIDQVVVSERDVRVVEIATGLMVLAILLVVYRRPVTMVVPLAMIGVALVVAQSLVVLLGVLGWGVTSQTVVLLSGMMMGAGTDYAVFLISRYHEYMERGAASDDAVVGALAAIGKVIAASAGTVGLAFLGMSFTRLPLLSTIGPALAMAIAVAFLAAITLLPAILVITGRRGWIAPRKKLMSRFWRLSAVRIVRRPQRHLVFSLVVLLILAGCATLVRYNYDDRTTLPASAQSNVGYAVMERHFAVNSLIPQYLLVQSPHDLRTPEALADLEEMASRVSQLPNIALLQGITRPTGQTLQQATLSYQAGEVGTRLGDTSAQINSNSHNLDKLTDGAKQLSDTLARVRGAVSQSTTIITTLVGTLTDVENRYGGTANLAHLDDLARLVSNLRSAGKTIGVNMFDIDQLLGWTGPVMNALNSSPVCDADPSCTAARTQLQIVDTARANGTFNQLSELARQLQGMADDQSIERLRASLNTVMKSLRSMGLTSPQAVTRQLSSLRQGANEIADGSKQLTDAVQTLVDKTKDIGSGLSEASAFLLSMRDGASQPSMAGFFVPPQYFGIEQFKQVAGFFISPDGHTARYLVQSKLNPFSTAAMDQLDAILDTAGKAQPNTSLSDATISAAGITALYHDMRADFNDDLRLIIIITVAVVMLILILLLRAIVAPLYLVASVIISYMAALGIGVIAFQFIGGQPLSWSVPALSFLVLVAVGADYNMLLVSRIRDESSDGIRLAIMRTIRSTGSVITSAGLIFAASMFGLLFGSVSTMVQAGFIVGVGILLDTFIVRTVTVPAMAVLVGRANWWPSKPRTAPATDVSRNRLLANEWDRVKSWKPAFHRRVSRMRRPSK
ncbi:RND family transporter [Mycobacterium sp. AZCC_0083]|uniref:MMPL/RND family transporter n=1 Tax=Mycobacterium sp. AZCC_0083 TaxID=2735882 RepID=UPI0017B1287F|nr:RND family transporter [Mycobacterium sp. AZCC_0083]MBB5167617.1 RND superfamily putative drug exporter [Mycobacterium sp. AZCC_0083]